MMLHNLITSFFIGEENLQSEQQYNLQARIYPIVVLFLIIAFSGCLTNNAVPNVENNSSQSGPIVRVIGGEHQVLNVSGQMIIVGGNFDEVWITNTDITKIIVSGSDNFIHYPQQANPAIENGGQRNIISSYEFMPSAAAVPTEQQIMDVTEDLPGTVNVYGTYEVQDISGKKIQIKGIYNQIKILNKDVSDIRINGNYNTIYYPKEANPFIINNGVGNKVETY